MGLQERALTAYCGLSCGDCIRYKSKASELASQLINELVKINFDNYSKDQAERREGARELRRNDVCLGGNSQIKMRYALQVGGNKCGQTCETAKCAHSKGIEGCWECTDREFEACNKFEFLRPFHGDAPQNNIKKFKKYGLDKWIKHREKCFRWL